MTSHGRWYLRVEQPDDSVELHLERLAGDHYTPAAVARRGEALASSEPFAFEIAVAGIDGTGASPALAGPRFVRA